jgi:NitT/TauT family transport system ATP-binding protein
MMAEPKIRITHLVKDFGDPGETQVRAIEDISLDVSDGEFVCIVGPSGCGKSTLLFILAGLERPTAGTVLVNGRAVRKPSRNRGMLFQQLALFPWRTTRQNVEFGLELRGVGRAERTRLSQRWLGIMGLEGFAHVFPHQLSGGMQQRVAIARLLVNEPEILLMDEPFAALDAQTRMLLGEELVRVWQQHRKTVLFVTHSVDEAIMLGDRVEVMTARPGRIKISLRIDLPRPRDPAEDAFNVVRRRVLALVREEVAKLVEVAQS